MLWNGKKIAAVAASILGSLSAVAAQDWPKVPFVPTLSYIDSVSGDPVCESFQHRVRSQFFDYFKPEVRASTPPLTMTGLKDISPRLVQNTYQNFDPAVIREGKVYNADIEGDGRPDFVWVTVRSRGINVLHRLQRITETFDPKSYPFDNQQQAMDYSGESQGIQDVIEKAIYPAPDKWMEILRFQGRIYIQVTMPGPETRSSVLLSYDHELNVKAECVVEIRPWIGDRKAGDPLGSGFALLFDAYERMLGRPASWRRLGFILQEQEFRSALMWVLYRPWTLTKSGPYEGRSAEAYKDWHRQSEGEWRSNEFREGERYLPYQFYWSLEGAYQRKTARKLQTGVDGARDELLQWYQNEFGVDVAQAKFWADRNLNYLRWIMTRRADESWMLRILGSLDKIHARQADALEFYRVAHRYLDYRNFPPSEMEAGELQKQAIDKALTLAVGAGAETSLLDRLIKEHGADPENGSEPAILNAVDHLEALRFFLEMGVNPDTVNPFGKSTLMMAAHLNEVEAVRLLLALNAEIDLRTYDTEMLGTLSQAGIPVSPVYFNQRTALMYAAENASLDIIQVLIDAGADITARDSRGRNILDYLSLNEGLSESDRVKARKLLAIAVN